VKCFLVATRDSAVPLKLVDVMGLSLTDNRASEIVCLWHNSADYVKCHQERLVQGRFHRSKKNIINGLWPTNCGVTMGVKP
jgi:hypothetical protein